MRNGRSFLAVMVVTAGLLTPGALSAAPYCAGVYIEVSGGGGESYVAMPADACRADTGSGCRAFTLNLSNVNHVCHDLYTAVPNKQYAVPFHPWSGGCSITEVV